MASEFQEQTERLAVLEKLLHRLIPDDVERKALEEQIGINALRETLAENMTPRYAPSPKYLPEDNKITDLEAAMQSVDYYRNAVDDGGDEHWPLTDRVQALKEAEKALQDLQGSEK